MNISSALSQINRWWTTGKVDNAFLYKTTRSEFNQIPILLNSNRIISIVGPRRVGKSTLIYQSIHYLLESGIAPRHLLLFSGDDPNLFSAQNTIGDVIETYTSEILNESLNNLTDMIYVFIDEIHAVKDWQTWLKHYYDRKLKIKFIVSGSSATHLFEGAKESLLGRIESIFVMPLSFSQFCEFWAIYMEDTKTHDYLQLLPKSCVFENVSSYYEELKEVYWQIEDFKPYVYKALKDYLLIGGYPEYFTVTGRVLWQKRLVEDIIAQGLYRDIINVYSIKNPERLERLLYFIAANNGQDFNYKAIADTIGCNSETVSGYLSFLQRAYLIIIQNNFSPNIGKSIRKNRKMYVLDNGIANALLHISEPDSTQEGHLVEACCVRDALRICEYNFWNLNYWRDNGNELDIVIDKKACILPVEVKYRNNPKADSFDAFARKFKNVEDSRLIITKNTFTKQDLSFSIPFWLMNGRDRLGK